MISSIQALDEGDKIKLTFGVFTVVCLALWFWWISPTLLDIEKAETQLQHKQEELSKMRALVTEHHQSYKKRSLEQSRQVLENDGFDVQKLSAQMITATIKAQNKAQLLDRLWKLEHEGIVINKLRLDLSAEDVMLWLEVK